MSISRREAILGLGSFVASPIVYGISSEAAVVSPIVPVGGPIVLTGKNNGRPNISARANGGFVVAWRELYGPKAFAYLRSYSPAGVSVAGPTRVAIGPVDSFAPIATDGGQTLLLASILKNYDERQRGEIFATPIDRFLVPTGKPLLIYRDAPVHIFSGVNVQGCRLSGGSILVVWCELSASTWLGAAKISSAGVVKRPRFSPALQEPGYNPIPYAVTPLSNGGSAIAFSIERVLFGPREVVVQRLNPNGDGIGRWVVIRGPSFGLDNGRDFGLSGLPGGGFVTAWVKNNRLFWQIHASTGVVTVPMQSRPLGGQGWANGPMGLATDFDGQIFVVTQQTNRISAWLMSPTGALLAGPTDIAAGYAVDRVARLAHRRFVVAFEPETWHSVLQIVRTGTT